MNSSTTTNYIVKITYPTVKQFRTSNVQYVMEGTLAETENLAYARQFISVKNAKSAIAARLKYNRCDCYTDAKFEIIKVESTVTELSVEYTQTIQKEKEN